MKSAVPPVHIAASATIGAPGMRVVATVVLMVALLAMSLSVAGAGLARPACSAPWGAADPCHGAALPGVTSDSGQNPGVCFPCLAPPQDEAAPARPRQRLPMAFGAVVLTGLRLAAPWRPPRA